MVGINTHSSVDSNSFKCGIVVSLLGHHKVRSGFRGIPEKVKKMRAVVTLTL